MSTHQNFQVPEAKLTLLIFEVRQVHVEIFLVCFLLINKPLQALGCCENFESFVDGCAGLIDATSEDDPTISISALLKLLI